MPARRTSKKSTGPTKKKPGPKPAKTAKPQAKRRPRSIRLSPHVRPTEVDVHVEVDPSQSDGFQGEVVHRLELARRTRGIELHADDLRLSRVRVEVDGRKVAASLVRCPERETVKIQLAESVPAGEATLSLSFRGKLRSDLRGLYAARAEERRYAFTQLEAADARRFFPCFDEPSFKARFRISVTTGAGNTVLSNGPAEKTVPLDNGRKTVHFERTPPLSTYLLALAVGDLEVSAPTNCGPTEIRVWHVPGKGALTAFALEAARETLARLEAYFDLPYPYAKLDLVAVPDFEAGAMENAGAVFFRETLLLVDPATVTMHEKKRVAEVICHELAHMWYGDLVTMAWWDDLWLNEAFATWMAFHIVDSWKPEWKMWNDFQHYRSAALGMDALQGTHPIYTTVRDPQEATENFDLITYEKGASVVRMIERYLGAEAFRAGVRNYIEAHQEANTVASDLWDALSDASEQEVEPIVRAWIEQPGFPLLRIRRERKDGETRLLLRQERFAPVPEKSRRSKKPSSASWPIPWVGRVGTGKERSRSVRHLMTRKRDTVPLPQARPRFLYGNADEGGFFRPLHEPDELKALTASRNALSAVERMGLVGHAWAAVRGGHAKVGPMLDLLLTLGDELDPDVLKAVAEPLAELCETADRSLEPEASREFRARISLAFEPSLSSCGLAARKRETDDERLRRAVLLHLVGKLGEHPETRREAARLCALYLDDRATIDPNLADTVVAIGAEDGDEALFERFLSEAEASATPQERRRFLMAIGAFQEPTLVQRALELCLTETVKTQDVAILLTRMLGNRKAREATWAFMQRRWKRLAKRMPPMMVTRPIEATPSLGGRRYRTEVARFFAKHPIATGQRAVKQALEQFDLDRVFDERTRQPLELWLREQGR
ncbi:MAG: M1 family peptidase [bacterium]|nr:M1 family peptidase [bacterium]